jgi:phosphosulfolactate synthase (CoM biosynthesis protein A)
VRTDADYSKEINQLVIQGIAFEVAQQIVNEGFIYRHGADVQAILFLSRKRTK